MQFGGMVDLSSPIMEDDTSEHSQHHQYDHMNGNGMHTAAAAPKTVLPMVSSQQQGTILINLTKMHCILEDFIAMHPNDLDALCLVAGTYLAQVQWLAAAAAAAANTNNKCTIQIYGLYDQGGLAPVSTFHMMWDCLDENTHTTFCCDSSSSVDTDECHSMPNVALDYDPISDLITVSAFLWNNTKGRNCDNDKVTATAAIPFVCLRSWRTNAQEFTAMAVAAAAAKDDDDSNKNTFSSSRSSASCCVSWLFFTQDNENQRGLAHLVVTSSFAAGGQTVRWRLHKELYETALLLPPRKRDTLKD